LATIAGADDWPEIALYGESKIEWLNKFLQLPNGIPSHDTFRRIFMMLDFAAFQTAFLSWIKSLMAIQGRDIIAIDGKTSRRSHEIKGGEKALHMVSAWSTKMGMVLA